MIIPDDPAGTAIELGEGDRSAGRRYGNEGVQQHPQSDNGPEFVARDIRKGLAWIGARTAYVEPRSPWENGFF